MDNQKKDFNKDFEYYEENDEDYDDYYENDNDYEEEYDDELSDEEELESLRLLLKRKKETRTTSENDIYDDEELPKPQPKKKLGKTKTPRGKSVSKKSYATKRLPAETKVLIVEAFISSRMSATIFGPLVNVSESSLAKWKRSYKKYGAEGFRRKKEGPPKGKSRLPKSTQEAILMIKAEHEEWGCQRIHDMLLRTKAFSASPGAIKRLLLSNGYEIVEEGRTRHPDKPRRFERARPQQMYQTDIFTFLLKRQNTRIYMIAYMDDCSRYIVSFGLTVKATSVWAQEVLAEAISFYGPPEEVLTDQGPQYHSWRGTSAYRKFVTKCGIKQIVAKAHHPQTLGKVERFWQTLWNECIEKAIFKDLTDAKERISHFVGWYNFQRTHQGISGMIPADKFFGAEMAIRENIEVRVASNALEIAKYGSPRKPLYLSGRIGEQSISLHAEGEKVILTTSNGFREEVDLAATGRTELNLPVQVNKQPMERPLAQNPDKLDTPPVIICEATPSILATPSEPIKLNDEKELLFKAALESLADATLCQGNIDEVKSRAPIDEKDGNEIIIFSEKGDNDGNS